MMFSFAAKVFTDRLISINIHFKVIKIQKIKPLITKLEMNYDENSIKLSQLYEQLADSYCAIDNFKSGVDCYKKQVKKICPLKVYLYNPF